MKNCFLVLSAWCSITCAMQNNLTPNQKVMALIKAAGRDVPENSIIHNPAHQQELTFLKKDYFAICLSYNCNFGCKENPWTYKNLLEGQRPVTAFEILHAKKNEIYGDEVGTEIYLFKAVDTGKARIRFTNAVLQQIAVKDVNITVRSFAQEMGDNNPVIRLGFMLPIGGELHAPEVLKEVIE